MVWPILAVSVGLNFQSYLSKDFTFDSLQWNSVPLVSEKKKDFTFGTVIAQTATGRPLSFPTEVARLSKITSTDAIPNSKSGQTVLGACIAPQLVKSLQQEWGSLTHRKGGVSIQDWAPSTKLFILDLMQSKAFNWSQKCKPCIGFENVSLIRNKKIALGQSPFNWTSAARLSFSFLFWAQH